MAETVEYPDTWTIPSYELLDLDIPAKVCADHILDLAVGESYTYHPDDLPEDCWVKVTRVEDD